MTEPRPNQDAELEAASEPVEQFRYLKDHVAAVIDTMEELTPTVDALLDAGFLESEILVFCGHEAADAIAATTGRSGLMHIAMRVAERLGAPNEEMKFKNLYEQALRNGQFLVAVFTPTEERTELAAQLLQSHGGHFIHHMRRFSLHVMHPLRQ
ncbi:MAG TPA: hypothetical protein VFJ96_11410 [Gemmatimonadaceae bacterium]|jgi:hypothetical protein|nr:hypothetical protein [Gemmatimonadaceae bacterium]